MPTTPIKEYIKELLEIVSKMQRDYPQKKFTFDGRLVGDIGEILAEQIYDLELLPGQNTLHDAKSHGRMVQIKTTMKESLGFGDIPDYYLGLKIDQHGNVEEIFNGPGAVVWEGIKHRKRPKSYLLSINITTLRNLNKDITMDNKIRQR